MSNNEVFETIFKKISIQIIDNIFTDMKIIKNNNMYIYTNNINIDTLIYFLNKNIDNISILLIKNLAIDDYISVKKILLIHFQSTDFIKSISKITYSFKSSYIISFDKMKYIYSEYIKNNMMNNSVIEQILSLSSEITFKNWIIRKKKIIIFGYIICINILIITYNIFIYYKLI